MPISLGGGTSESSCFRELICVTSAFHIAPVRWDYRCGAEALPAIGPEKGIPTMAHPLTITREHEPQTARDGAPELWVLVIEQPGQPSHSLIRLLRSHMRVVIAA